MTETITTFQFTIPGRNGGSPTEYSSPNTDEQVYHKLVQYVADGTVKGDFPRDLCGGYTKWRKFTPGQRPWAHKFVLDAEKPNQNVQVDGFESIVKHMRGAADSGMKNPQIRIEYNGVKFTLKLAGRGSRNCGKVSVAESHKFGEGAFYGWIGTDGKYQRYSAASDALVAVLAEIATDPATAINKMGLQAGHCCYCWAALTQVQSRMVGCGKTCSDHYNVPYPNAAETRRYIQDNPGVLVGASDAERWTK